MSKLKLSVNQGKLGFTLVEVAVVIGVVAILAAVSIPSFVSWMPKYRLKSAARDLYSDLQKAKISAVKRNQTVSLNFTAGTGTPPSCTGGSYIFVDGNGIAVVTKTMTKGVCLSTPSVFPAGFRSNSLPSGVIGSVLMSHGRVSTTYTITQTIAGGITLR